MTYSVCYLIHTPEQRKGEPRCVTWLVREKAFYANNGRHGDSALTVSDGSLFSIDMLLISPDHTAINPQVPHHTQKCTSWVFLTHRLSSDECTFFLFVCVSFSHKNLISITVPTKADKLVMHSYKYISLHVIRRSTEQKK